MSLGDAFPVNTGLSSRLAAVSAQAASSRTQMSVTRQSSVPLGLAAGDDAAHVSLTGRPELVKVAEAKESARADAAQASDAEQGRMKQAAFKLDDAAMAEEAVAFATANITQRPGTAMLAQGGISNQRMLSLMR